MIDLAGLEARQKEAKKLTASTLSDDDAQRTIAGDFATDWSLIQKRRLIELRKSVNQGYMSREKLVEARRMQVEAELKLAELRAGMNGGVGFATAENQSNAGGSFAC